jgi:hypothetical protein
VDKALRLEAHRRKVSLNRLVVDELANLAGVKPDRELRSLAGLAGKMGGRSRV